jgi:hypothetical protein
VEKLNTDAKFPIKIIKFVLKNILAFADGSKETLNALNILVQKLMELFVKACSDPKVAYVTNGVCLEDFGFKR